MSPKEKNEELQKCADRHRAIHDWRQKLESRVLFTSFSFYEPYRAKVVGISDGDTIKVLHNGK